MKYSSLNKLIYHFNIFLGPCSFCFCLIVVKALFLGSPHGHVVKNLSNRKKNQSTKSLNEIKLKKIIIKKLTKRGAKKRTTTNTRGTNEFFNWNILKKRDPNDRFHRTEIASPISRLIWNDNSWTYT